MGYSAYHQHAMVCVPPGKTNPRFNHPCLGNGGKWMLFNDCNCDKYYFCIIISCTVNQETEWNYSVDTNHCYVLQMKWCTCRLHNKRACLSLPLV